MIIKKMRVNHVEEPLGYKIDYPVFSWICESAGKKQTWAKIEISLSDDFSKILYDSGSREDVLSLSVPVQIPLLPRTRYYWRVTICADNGETGSGVSWFETGKNKEPWTAKWITDELGGDVHPYYKKDISVNKNVSQARAYVCGLGVFELEINEEKVGNEIMTPYYTDYNHWIQYITFDITDKLRQGYNEIGVLIGNGWYKGRYGFGEGLDKLYGDKFLLLCELHITYEDGECQVIGSDESWQYCKSRILLSGIYNGEDYDARIKKQDWKNAVLADNPCALITERMSLPVVKTEKIKPIKLINMGMHFTQVN